MRTKITSEDYPLNPGESWWIINPNSGGAEFVVPHDASTCCMEDILDFKKGTVYGVHIETDGWVCVKNKEHVVEMPQYLFARHFDAEVFVRGSVPRIYKNAVSIPSVWVDSPINLPLWTSNSSLPNEVACTYTENKND